jgi:hypothetical protein
MIDLWNIALDIFCAVWRARLGVHNFVDHIFLDVSTSTAGSEDMSEDRDRTQGS